MPTLRTKELSRKTKGVLCEIFQFIHLLLETIQRHTSPLRDRRGYTQSYNESHTFLPVCDYYVLRSEPIIELLPYILGTILDSELVLRKC